MCLFGFILWQPLALKAYQLTVDDGCKDSHALKVWITHCLIQDKASKTGHHKHRGNQCHITIMIRLLNGADADGEKAIDLKTSSIYSTLIFLTLNKIQVLQYLQTTAHLTAVLSGLN